MSGVQLVERGGGILGVIAVIRNVGTYGLRFWIEGNL